MYKSRFGSISDVSPESRRRANAADWAGPAGDAKRQPLRAAALTAARNIARLALPALFK